MAIAEEYALLHRSRGRWLRAAAGGVWRTAAGGARRAAGGDGRWACGERVASVWRAGGGRVAMQW